MTNKLQSDRRSLLRSLWLRAQTETITIPCRDKAAAYNARFQLYNAVREFRKNPELSPQLTAALDVVSAAIPPPGTDGRWCVVLGRSQASDALDEAFAALGITGEEPAAQDPLEQAAAASLARLSSAGLIELTAQTAIGEGELVTPHGYPLRRAPDRG